MLQPAYGALSVSALFSLVALTFDLLTLKLVRVIARGVRWATFLPILVFLRRFVLDLWVNTFQKHHVTLRVDL